MGKHKTSRKKYHQTSIKNKAKEDTNLDNVDTAPLLLQPPSNLFAGINIDVDSLKTNVLEDDLRSVKSFKSSKSDLGEEKTLSKKDKRLARKQMLLKKLDLINQVRKGSKSKKKRRGKLIKKEANSIMGDTKLLLDALPSIESLTKTKSNIRHQTKKKAVEKTSRRKKQSALDIKLFSKIMQNKEFKKNPFESISDHINAVVNFETSNLKK